MNKKAEGQIIKKAAIKSLTVAAKIIIGMFELVDDMNYMRSHQSLCLAMSVGEVRAYMAEIEEYRKEHRHTFRRLKNRGWIIERKIGGRMLTVLTESGKVAALEIRLKTARTILLRGEYWMIAFDFPEVAHKARDKFRRYLKRVGFNRHQQSIWCSKKDIGNEIWRLIKILGVDKWVRLYRATERR
jgi:CRISPR-associated endonuclease Cas2